MFGFCPGRGAARRGNAVALIVEVKKSETAGKKGG
jgi:hypothetical protein